MNSPTRTIILLSAKRCGSTALFHIFQKHPDVSICHHDRNIVIWEPNFWNGAARAIEGNPQPFIQRLSQSLPSIRPPATFTQDTIFRLWEEILSKHGPIMFDKSPQYLSDYPALDLLHRFHQAGNDVRLIGMIRDGRDSISSQFERWSKPGKDDSPEIREKHWLKKYAHLMELPAMFGRFPLFRYEDFALAPQFYARTMFEHCGLPYHADTVSHIHPENVGRYSISTDPMIRRWKMSAEFIQHLRDFGYPVPQLSFGGAVSLYIQNKFKLVAKFKNKLIKRFSSDRRAA